MALQRGLGTLINEYRLHRGPRGPNTCSDPEKAPPAGGWSIITTLTERGEAGTPNAWSIGHDGLIEGGGAGKPSLRLPA